MRGPLEPIRAAEDHLRRAADALATAAAEASAAGAGWGSKADALELLREEAVDVQQQLAFLELELPGHRPV
jgi:hypothetical protein